ASDLGSRMPGLVPGMHVLEPPLLEGVDGDGTRTCCNCAYDVPYVRQRETRATSPATFARENGMADPSFDIIIIGSGPGGYVTAIRAAQLGFSTAIVERDYLGGICLNWGCIPTKALLRSAEIFHYMQHPNDYGLSAEKVTYDPAAVVKRSRAVSKRLNDGVGFLMRKNKVTVIWGEAMIDAPGKVTVKTSATEAPKGALGPGTYQAKHIIIATGARPRHHQTPDLTLFRGYGARRKAEVAVGRRFGRDGHRVRLVLPHLRRRGDGGRDTAANSPRRGCRDCGIRAQAIREARHQDPDRRQGDEARQEGRRRDRDHRRRQRRHANVDRRARHLRGRRYRQHRASRPRKAWREDRPRRHRGRSAQSHQCARHLRHRRRCRPAVARAQGRARGRHLRRDDQGPQASSHGQAPHPGLHL